MKKIISTILVCILVISVLAGCGKNKVTMDDILADTNMVVGTIAGQDVYAYELIYYLKQGAAIDEAKDVILQTKVLLNIGKENGIEFTEEMQKKVDEFINSGLEQHGSKEALESIVLENGGITIDQYSALYKDSLVVQEVVNKVIELGVVPEATDEDAKEFYDTYCLKAKHILFSTVAEDGTTALGEEEVAAKLKKAQDTLEAIKGGSDFDSFVNLSEDPGSATQPEGYVFVNTSLIEDESLYATVQQVGLTMVPEFEQGTAALEIGAVSDIVTSDFGHHIIKRLELTDADYEMYKETFKGILSNLNFSNYLKDSEANADVKWNVAAVDTLTANVKPVQQQATQQ